MFSLKTFGHHLGSGIWCGVNHGVRVARRKGYLRAVRIGFRVISVGNIQAGGAGKTPMVAFIAREALSRGFTPCILTRGYGGRWEQKGGEIGPGAKTPEPHECGDESALLHDLVPQAWIGIGSDRISVFEKLRNRLPEKSIVILDDGFQYWKIARDVNIVLLTSARPGEVLFREGTEALRDAGLLLWTKGHNAPLGYEESPVPKARIRFRLNPNTSMEPVWLVTAVGHPEDVLESAKQANYRIARHLRFTDHAAYSRQQIAGIVDQATKQGCRVLVTGKDWVKWRALGVAPGLVSIIEPEVIFEEGRDAWLRTLWGA